MSLRLFAVVYSLFLLPLCVPLQAFATESILVDQPRGKLVRLLDKGQPACGVLGWNNVRRSGSFVINGKSLEIQESKLPLSKEQWEALLSRVVGQQQEITIAHDWKKLPAGLAAALRVAYDLRSHGGTAWVLNGPIGKHKPATHCRGQFAFAGQARPLYLPENDFWHKLQQGRFLDARGRGASEPPAYTWVTGSPRNARQVDIASFVNNGKLDRDSYSCDLFDGATVAGCDSLHKTYLLVEAARYAKCKSQPALMPAWGLAGASRDRVVAQKLWGKDVALNNKRSGDWTH